MSTTMEKIESYFKTIGKTDSQKSAFNAFCTFANTLGFEVAVYDVRKAPHGLASFHFTNFPEDLVQHYIQKRYARFDVIVNRAATTVLPYTWQDCLDKFELSEDQLQVRKDINGAGLASGAIIPLHGPEGTIAYISLATSMDKLECSKVFLSNRAALQIVATYMHEKVISFCKRDARHVKSPLTPREMDVVLWAAQGKSNSEIATIMKIAESTIKTHLQSIFLKLDVRNKHHAIGYALSNGLISF